MAEATAEVFGSKHPELNINIQSVGSSAGIKAVQDGTASIGMSSRELTSDEKKGLNEELIALDGIAIIANNGNSVKGMSNVTLVS